MKKHTKIVATVSDLRCDVDFVKKLYKAGMNVVRMNTAHVDFEGLDRLVSNVREVSEKIALLMDTKGPEIRTTKCEDGDIHLKTGEKVIIKGNPKGLSNKDVICVSYADITNDVGVGSHILFDDGEIDIVVEEVQGNELHCEVLNNCVLGSRKSVNVPGVRINLPSLTERDLEFIHYAIEKDIEIGRAEERRVGKECRSRWSPYH